MVRIHLLLTAASALALAALPAHAQAANGVAINNQLQWGDVFATMTVVSRPQAQGVEANALAAGNTVHAQNSVAGQSLTSDQTMSGATVANSAIEAQDACCHAVSTASAQANAAAIDSAARINANLLQTTDGGDVGATATASLRNTSELTTGASAAGNNIVLTGKDGDLTTDTFQNNGVSVRATADSDACCTGYTATSAVASGNTYTSSSQSMTVYSKVAQKSATGEVVASADAYQYRAYDMDVAANAAGNSAQIDNKWGYAQLDTDQDNSSTIRAESRVTAGTWEGDVTSSAYGVGNTVMTSNVGSDMMTTTAQENTGDVSSFASFDGGAASAGTGSAIVSATAIGNAYTGFVCSQCGDAALTASVNQISGGAITATGSINAIGGRGLVGSASAIGNSATFLTTSGR
jgi:hypothetical protein